ncbi:MAG: DUF459 domain-containing protein [Brevundimonas sp.]|uniref:SGNH/GDSL hydrolase family protein n=1 Tax=Brevundimonas sp. TaxID=1871086 RepID=UPI002736A485|nr:DUF459 domain-containing protein [Brevundimonas sp.]MDP3379704.1 DUF459 domain-containing protein [Brevundimonas sp.]
MRAGINALTVAFVVGVLAGLLLTPDGRAWLSNPTLMLGGQANASATATEAAAVEAPVEAEAPVAPPSSLKARYADGTLTIGVFGDSMADGLWAALYRDLGGLDGVDVVKFSEVSTGLSRYDYVDIQAKSTRQLAERPVDVAIILFGTNDAQAIVIDGQIHPFGSDGWKAAYAQRVDNLVGLMRSRGAEVYWVGLPRMKSSGFDERMTIINDVVEARMTALGVPYFDTVALTSNEAGGYEAYLSDKDGRRRLMRAGDGIHMSMSGYLRMADPVADRLKADLGVAEAKAVTATP